MPNKPFYLPKYTKNWALVIGINDYTKANRLGYAGQDAEVFADVIEAKFDFKSENITLLTDKEASGDAVRSAFLKLAGDATGQDDRVIFFFAGHGHTIPGRRGEVGYLVPVDGDPAKLETLIRWDELTRNADLIAAKHVLFVMDACYGGLAFTRALSPGSSRFLKSMLQKFSRQVLTAGKADELVADAGGPRPGHSIFTGHLLNALEGAAATSDGIISANGVMQYVYERVAKDVHSRQTPHFGFLDGDGDFIFHAPQLGLLTSEKEIDKDILIELPDIAPTTDLDSAKPPLFDRLKEYLSDSRYRIKLDDLTTAEIRSALHSLREEAFPVASGNSLSPAELLQRYEQAISGLIAAIILIARWGESGHQYLLQNILSRLADPNIPKSGRSDLLGLRWYPEMFLMYAGGIAAISQGNYLSLTTILTGRLASGITIDGNTDAAYQTVQEILEVDRTDFFKLIAGHERHFTPRSEYVFKAIQPRLEDVLLIGKAYEDCFDRFEILYALVHAHQRDRKGLPIWGPVGRFGWKHKSHRASQKPYDLLLQEATERGEEWDVIQYGLFDRSIERFKKIANEYRENLNQLHWY